MNPQALLDTLSRAVTEDKLSVGPSDLTDLARIHHTAEWRVKLAFTRLSPLERERLAEWLRVASSVAQERLLAEGIRRAQEFMAVDPHALDQRLNWNPPPKARPLRAKPPLESADDILGD